jgi:GT2 family glycosyltransferase
VVVPTCRRPELLHRCLAALVTQNCDPASYEIVVVDDARCAQTARAVRRFARRRAGGPVIRYRCPPAGRRGPAAARNAGWRAARGEIVAFTDDDTLPASNWLSAGLRAMRAPEVAAASGDVVVPLPDVPTDWERNSAGLDGAEFVTANCFVRRAALERIGGFDERFTRPWREDSDLYFTLLESGATVVRAPAALVIHPVRPAPRGVSVRLHRNLFFDALLYKKHRRLYRTKIAAAPPLRYYVIVAALVTALAALLGGRPDVAAAAVTVWLVLTAGFTARRLHGTSRDWRDVADMALTSAVIPPVAVFWRLAGALHFRVVFA